MSIRHDCAHPSALRFLMPRSRPAMIDVREADQAGELGSTPPVGRVESDGGGMARAPICGERPVRLDFFGPETRR